MTGGRISTADAAARVSAYVYGNIVILAALVSLSRDDAVSGVAALVLPGIALSTFLAHALAGGIGRILLTEESLTTRDVFAELRGSVPILTSALLPGLLMAAARLTSIPAVYAQLLAGLYLVVRLGLIGALVARYRGAPSSKRVVLAGVALGVLGAAITAAKVLLGH